MIRRGGWLKAVDKRRGREGRSCTFIFIYAFAQVCCIVACVNWVGGGGSSGESIGGNQVQSKTLTSSKQELGVELSMFTHLHCFASHTQFTSQNLVQIYNIRGQLVKAYRPQQWPHMLQMLWKDQGKVSPYCKYVQV